MQLVDRGVVMYDTMKDRRIGPAEVMEKFGVPPDKVIEVQALVGDSTDNVPGVPGIGVKTAAQLISDMAISRRCWRAPARSSSTSAAQVADRECRHGAAYRRRSSR